MAENKELRLINFIVAFSDKLENATLVEYPSGSWKLIVAEKKFADIHNYGLAGWDVQFVESDIYGQADKDEILSIMGISLTERYPANGYVPREAARLIY